MQKLVFCFLALALSAPVLSDHVSRQSGPTVTLSYGTFQGVSLLGVADAYRGIPFAQAERFGFPQLPANKSGIQQATAFGPACPQVGGASGLKASEDCLFVNVIKPSNIPAGVKLPVVFWIYGGGFEGGDTSQNDGAPLVGRSIAQGEPIIYVSANYRLNVFGFLGSKEAKAAGVVNLGLRDQRFAMQWIQNNIAAFGGDASKVVIWGESAGSLSVAVHLLINGGNPAGLFRGAVMQSGAPMPLPDATAGQPFYDQLVASANCAASPNTMACLKSAPFQTLQNAANQIGNASLFMGLHLPWRPYVDGVVITENPLISVQRGAYAKVPLISGNCDDEGTLFSLFQSNLTTDEEVVNYIHNNFLPTASDAQFQPVIDHYPNDPTVGSPFDTGLNNQLYPQFKRIAAIQGDLIFQAPRRAFMQIASRTQNAWGFLYKRGKGTAIVGAAHGTDLQEFYGNGLLPDFQGTDALVHFVNNLDPNVGNTTSGLISWPKYNAANASEPPLLTFLDSGLLTISPDTYRVDDMEALGDLFAFYV